MATAYHNLSDYDFNSVPNAENMRFGIVVSEWNNNITGPLLEVDAVIAIGCVVRGDTPHFDYVCAGTTQGIAQLNAEGDIPVIYGLITTNTMQQAEDRAGGRLGNKGDECAITAIKMLDFKEKLQKTQIF